jgi:hypothetical protein
MATHADIARAFVKAYPYGKGPKIARHVFREPFDGGDVIYSYGHHFPLAIRNDTDKTFLVNGDRWGHVTAGHQSEVRGAIHNRNDFKDYKVLTVPCSIFQRVYSIHYWKNLHIKLIDVGVDKEICECLTCGKSFDNYSDMYEHRKLNDSRMTTPAHKTHYFHQLAPSCFSADVSNGTNPKYFLSGFDATANTRNHDGYFLCELRAKPKNIAHAFELLKPDAVKNAEKRGLKVSRQGDIFAIPTNLDTRKLKKIGEYIHGGNAARMVWGARYNVIEYPRLFDTSHCATEVITTPKAVYARGIIRHRPTTFGRSRPEHMNVAIGKSWHRMVRNTALASYTTEGRVD